MNFSHKKQSQNLHSLGCHGTCYSVKLTVGERDKIREKPKRKGMCGTAMTAMAVTSTEKKHVVHYPCKIRRKQEKDKSSFLSDE